MSTINIDNAEHYKWGNDADGWHLVKTPSLSVIQEKVPPGASESRHYHEQAQQFFYVLAGTAHIELAGVTHEVSAGSGIHIPAKQPHQLMNHGGVDLEFLVVSEPMSHGDRVDAREHL